MLRVANERLNTISDATARLWMLHTEITAEGSRFRRFKELHLVRSNQPMFILTWTIFHALDEHSPLYGLTEADFETRNIGFVLMITATTNPSRKKFARATITRTGKCCATINLSMY